MDIKKIGIMGGSFDPIHHGHLIISERAREQFGLDRIIFMPTGRPPHKNKQDMSSVEDRYRMTYLAIESNQAYSISDLETKSLKTSYTIDSLSRLRDENIGAELYFILGADSFINLSKWKDYKKILADYRIIVARRPVFEDLVFDKIYKDYKEAYRESVFLLDSPIIDISSSYIRERRSRGQSVRYMVPDSVNDYIVDRKLYID